jgi:hypothetical protein
METQTNAPVAAPPEPELPLPIRKSKIERVLGATVNELLKANPASKPVRAQCLNLLAREIPPNLIEYDKIKDWIEFNIEPRKAVARQSGRGNGAGLTVDAAYSYTEVGTANYTQPYSGSGEVTLREDQLRELINIALERGQSFNRLVERVEEELRELVSDQVETESQRDPQYGNHDGNDTVHHDKTIESDVEDILRDWLENDDPGALETLDSN